MDEETIEIDPVEALAEVSELDEIRPSDRVAKRRVVRAQRLSEQTGYPGGLSADQVCSLVLFYVGRRALTQSKMIRPLGVLAFTREEVMAVRGFAKWWGFEVPKEVMDKKGLKPVYMAICGKYKGIIDFLKTHPAYVTHPIYEALKAGNYKSVISNIVFVTDELGNTVPRIARAGAEGPRAITPVGQTEALLWEIQGVAMDKLMMVMRSITLKDIEKSTLGMKAKALRDIYSVVHMARIGVKSPNLTLVQMNVNRAEGKDKLKGFSGYVNKNREES